MRPRVGWLPVGDHPPRPSGKTSNGAHPLDPWSSHCFQEPPVSSLIDGPGGFQKASKPVLGLALSIASHVVLHLTEHLGPWSPARQAREIGVRPKFCGRALCYYLRIWQLIEGPRRKMLSPTWRHPCCETYQLSTLKHRLLWRRPRAIATTVLIVGHEQYEARKSTIADAHFGMNGTYHGLSHRFSPTHPQFPATCRGCYGTHHVLNMCQPRCPTLHDDRRNGNAVGPFSVLQTP